VSRPKHELRVFRIGARIYNTSANLSLGEVSDNSYEIRGRNNGVRKRAVKIYCKASYRISSDYSEEEQDLSNWCQLLRRRAVVLFVASKRWGGIRSFGVYDQ
jgi:hypothetical protein